MYEGNALRILVIDDDVDTAQSVTYLLLDLGHQVMFTNNGESALEIAGRFRPEVVFADLVLPDTDGATLARSLRAVVKSDALRIYAVTGYPEEQWRAGAERVFDGHFLKPMHPGALERLVGRVGSNGGRKKP
jgi:CheY-like chemotaxis protein